MARQDFLQDIANSITNENFAEKITLENFIENLKPFVDDLKNSALRKVYDSYLDIYEKYWAFERKEKDYEIEKQIWIAKLAYQEKRKSQGKFILPQGFTKSMKKIEEKLGPDLFRKFLEVIVAYHKYLGGKD